MSLDDVPAMTPQDAQEAARRAVPNAVPVADPSMPPLARDLPKSETFESAGIWENVSSAWTEDTITRNRRGYHSDQRRDLAASMYDLLPADAKLRVQKQFTKSAHGWTDMEPMLFDEIGRDIAKNPARYGDVPLTQEAFDQRVNANEKDELEAAQTTLDKPGGTVGSFVGGAASSMFNLPQAALMVATGGPTGGFLTTMAANALFGAAGEAIDLPDQYATANRLDLPDPDPVGQIAAGALAGGAFAGAIHGAARLPAAIRFGNERIGTMMQGRRDGVLSAKPRDLSAPDAAIEVDEAEARLRGDTTVQEDLAAPRPDDAAKDGPEGAGVPRTAKPGEPPPFDYSPTGNASSRTNRVGYVMGKFIESGMDPHVAAGFVGNFVQESGPGLNTKAVGDGGNAFGFAQWNDRRAALLEFARTRGEDPGNVDLQVAFVLHELRTTERGAWEKIKAAKSPEEAAYLVSKLYERPGTPHNANRIAVAKDLARQYETGTVPKYQGARVYADGETTYTGNSGTSRGYTGEGQVSAGDTTKIDVDYQVVDLSDIFRATGDFQPRDRSRGTSDAWIADTAARLDPAQLGPSPTADRGAPIVGPDGMIESGNGRVGAIERAYAQHPDRALAYRAAIEQQGFAVPDGMERPVLIARRKTEMSPAELKRFVVDAQDSGVAAMTPTEVARASGRAMTAPVLARLDPAQPLHAAANGDFVRGALAALPRSARNAMFDASGVLNKEGQRQLRAALFARAWADQDILARFTETDAGPLKSLIDALEQAAPEWAALKADIEAGHVRADMDISDYVLDAMRLIGAARDVASRDGLSIGHSIDELLADVDMLDGAVSPLTTALVKKFWRNGKAAKADEVGAFLTRYAADARKAGATGGLFDGPTPRDVLRAIDADHFANLPENVGRSRGFAQPEPAAPQALPPKGFDAGAESPEAKAADAEMADDLRGPKRAVEGQSDAQPPLTPTDPVRDAERARIDGLRAQFLDLEIDLPDNSTVTAREVLDDIDADAGFDAFIQACATIPTGAPA